MEKIKTVKGGQFLVKETSPQDIFIPEEISEEQKMIMETCHDFQEKEKTYDLVNEIVRDNDIIVDYEAAGYIQMSKYREINATDLFKAIDIGIVIEALNNNLYATTEQIRQLADRHFGIGFDQLLLVEPPS